MEETDSDFDLIEDFVVEHGIIAKHKRIPVRPDVSEEEQLEWARQDPDFPPEHYQCELLFGDRTITVYQTVGADYPDEDDESTDQDLYADQRELLLSPEFLLETNVLKATSVDNASDFNEWVRNGYCETLTPSATYQSYVQLRDNLVSFLGTDLYQAAVKLAVDAEEEREESED